MNVKFNNCERKIKLPFIIYADFENISVPEDNREQNLEETYRNKYQKHCLQLWLKIKMCS